MRRKRLLGDERPSTFAGPSPTTSLARTRVARTDLRCSLHGSSGLTHGGSASFSGAHDIASATPTQGRRGPRETAAKLARGPPAEPAAEWRQGLISVT